MLHLIFTRLLNLQLNGFNQFETPRAQLICGSELSSETVHSSSFTINWLV
jgi:hypothetical protein